MRLEGTDYQNRVRIFVSYAHRDEKLRIALDKHLAMIKRLGRIDSWHDRRIGPGSDFGREISNHLDDAQLILLLVSPDFLASEYCYSREMERAMQMHASGRARVIPVILRPVDWTDAPFAKLQALPLDAKPVTRWSNRDAAFFNISEGIKSVIAQLVDSAAREPRSELAHYYRVSGFSASFVHIGGVGSRFVTKTVWLLDEHGYLPPDEYTIHYFNGPTDIMWVACSDDFRIIEVSSPTGNSVFPMEEGNEDTAFGIQILDQLKNTIVITCAAKLEPSAENDAAV